MGVLVRGKVARQVTRFWAYCLQTRVFVPVQAQELLGRAAKGYTDPS
jgi:hypothetical protein